MIQNLLRLVWFSRYRVSVSESSPYLGLILLHFQRALKLANRLRQFSLLFVGPAQVTRIKPAGRVEFLGAKQVLATSRSSARPGPDTPPPYTRANRREDFVGVKRFTGGKRHKGIAL
jgi:hypothetical protein